MNIIWIASYPKSGNTFMRTLLFCYYYTDGTLESSAGIERKIPDIHKLLSGKVKLNVQMDRSVFVKTHFLANNKHPYWSHTNRFIYIVRNPRDVLLSNARYLGVDAQHEHLVPFVQSFIEKRGVEKWSNMGMGNWPSHVGSWLDSSARMPFMFLKYEDLKHNTLEVLENVVNFISGAVDQKKIERVVESCHIDKMRDLEVSEKQIDSKTVFDYLPNSQYFIGEGNSNQSLSFLGKDVDKAFSKVFDNYSGIIGY